MKELETRTSYIKGGKKLKFKWSPKFEQDLDATVNPSSPFFDETVYNSILEVGEEKIREYLMDMRESYYQDVKYEFSFDDEHLDKIIALFEMKK